MSCKAEWLKLGADLRLVRCNEIIVVDRPVLDDLDLLFKRDVGWTKDFSDTELEFQKKWGLYRITFPAWR